MGRIASSRASPSLGWEDALAEGRAVALSGAVTSLEIGRTGARADVRAADGHLEETSLSLLPLADRRAAPRSEGDGGAGPVRGRSPRGPPAGGRGGRLPGHRPHAPAGRTPATSSSGARAPRVPGRARTPARSPCCSATASRTTRSSCSFCAASRGKSSSRACSARARGPIARRERATRRTPHAPAQRDRPTRAAPAAHPREARALLPSRRARRRAPRVVRAPGSSRGRPHAPRAAALQGPRGLAAPRRPPPRDRPRRARAPRRVGVAEGRGALELVQVDTPFFVCSPALLRGRSPRASYWK